MRKGGLALGVWTEQRERERGRGTERSESIQVSLSTWWNIFNHLSRTQHVGWKPWTDPWLIIETCVGTKQHWEMEAVLYRGRPERKRRKSMSPVTSISIDKQAHAHTHTQTHTHQVRKRMSPSSQLAQLSALQAKTGDPGFYLSPHFLSLYLLAWYTVFNLPKSLLFIEAYISLYCPWL